MAVTSRSAGAIMTHVWREEQQGPLPIHGGDSVKNSDIHTCSRPADGNSAMSLLRRKHVPQWYKDFYNKIDADPGLLVHGGHEVSRSNAAHFQELENDSPDTSKLDNGTSLGDVGGRKCSEQIYHVLLTTSNMNKDPTQVIEKLRIIGSYDNLRLAKAAAHRALFDAGYEAEFFKEYGITSWAFEQQHVVLKARHGLMINAVAEDNTIFQVRLATTENTSGLVAELDDGRITRDLYYVVQTTMDYRDGSEGEGSREHIVEGCYDNYDAARELALKVLLSPNDGLTKSSYAQYDEAGPNDIDCGFGTNVVVHAVGKNGENLMISVIKGHVLESVRLMEACMRLR